MATIPIGILGAPTDYRRQESYRRQAQGLHRNAFINSSPPLSCPISSPTISDYTAKKHETYREELQSEINNWLKE